MGAILSSIFQLLTLLQQLIRSITPPLYTRIVHNWLVITRHHCSQPVVSPVWALRDFTGLPLCTTALVASIMMASLTFPNVVGKLVCDVIKCNITAILCR